MIVAEILMDKDKVRYLLNYHTSLMTKEERIAWRHWSTSYKMDKSNSTAKQKESRKQASLRMGWLTEDVEILKLLENGIDEFEWNVALRINRTNVIKYNTCPKCSKLARTPKAKQCRFCGYDWH